MKKILIIVGIIILVFVLCVLALLLYLSHQPVAPTDYQKTVQTGGKIETEYMANGTYEVSTYEETVLQGFGKYIIYYSNEKKIRRVSE